MSKKYLAEIFKHLTLCKAWSLQLVQINESRKNGISYVCRKVDISPKEKLLDFVEATGKYYSDKGLENIPSVDDYTGDIVNNVISKLNKDNELIAKEYEALIQAAGNPDSEINLSEIKAKAAIYKGTVSVDATDVSVMLVSMQKPITALSNRFAYCIETNKFREIPGQVLTLRKKIDVAIIGDTVYLFTLDGEKLFNMERAYKTACKNIVKEIIKCGFLTDTVAFETIANNGKNPRRFVSYNKDHFEWLKNKENRNNADDQFDLSLDKYGNIVTSDEDSVEKLVKFLCNKVMLDPCDATPVEVTSAKPWRK